MSGGRGSAHPRCDGADGAPSGRILLLKFLLTSHGIPRTDAKNDGPVSGALSFKSTLTWPLGLETATTDAIASLAAQLEGKAILPGTRSRAHLMTAGCALPRRLARISTTTTSTTAATPRTPRSPLTSLKSSRGHLGGSRPARRYQSRAGLNDPALWPRLIEFRRLLRRSSSGALGARRTVRRDGRIQLRLR